LNLFEKRQQISKLPSLGVPIIIITCSGPIIHHEIGATPTAQNLSLGEHTAAPAHRLAFSRDVKHGGLFRRVEKLAVQCGRADCEIVAVCGSCFDEEDARFGGSFCDAPRNDTSCCTA
jgi:hypothetical protein